MRRTKQEAAHTRELLLDSAERLFLDKGVSRTSLEEIARAAGMTRGAIYWHFRNKADLFEAMHERVSLPLDELLARVTAEERPLIGLERFCVATIQSLVTDCRRRRVYTILTQKCEYVEELRGAFDRQQVLRSRFLHRITEVFNRVQQLGQLEPGVQPRAAAHALHAIMVGLFNDILREGRSGTAAAEAAAALHVFFRGLDAGAHNCRRT